jgi:hypothetical protein
MTEYRETKPNDVVIGLDLGQARNQPTEFRYLSPATASVRAGWRDA